MKVRLGEEYTLSAVQRVNWIIEHFDEDKYKIIAEGFLINDYYAEFTEEKYATLYYLRYPK